jgi:hypothetical protein
VETRGRNWRTGERGFRKSFPKIKRAVLRSGSFLCAHGSIACGIRIRTECRLWCIRREVNLSLRRLRRPVQERKCASSHLRHALRRTTARRYRIGQLRWSRRVHPLGKRPDKTTRGLGLLLDPLDAACSLLLRAVYTSEMSGSLMASHFGVTGLFQVWLPVGDRSHCARRGNKLQLIQAAIEQDEIVFQ